MTHASDAHGDATYCMLEAIDDDGRKCAAREISSCVDDDEFEHLATLYITDFLRFVNTLMCC